MNTFRTTFKVHDQFCGAGGSSLGIRNLSNKYGGGIEVSLAMNHWRLAVETHSTNFPETDHDCADISATDPRRYPGADMMITSPECTNHSIAKGVARKYQQTKNLFGDICIDPSAERSRATMWDVPRFAEYHNYKIIIVENVVDARMWIMWDAWLHAMHNLGYLHKCVYLNSMHALPTPQSRDRMYVVFWKKGNKAPDLNITPKAYCEKCVKEVYAVQSWKNPAKKFGKYRQQYLYRCPYCGSVVEPYYYSAFNCIDWSLKASRIGDRVKPLSPNTIRRIEYGIEKFGSQAIHLNIPGAGCPGFLSKQYGGNFDVRNSPVGLNETMGTITTRDHHAFVGLPIFAKVHGTGLAYPATEPAHTILAGGLHHGVVGVPFITENFGQSEAKPISAPIGCQTTKPSYGLVSNQAVNAFLSYYYGQTTLSKLSDPIGTMTTKERVSLVLVPQNKIDINDCTYRMLKDHEIKAAMAFNKDYIILGGSKDKIKQLGNVVTPPAMELLAERCILSLM